MKNILFIIALIVVSFAKINAQNTNEVLKPENNNEARLNGLQPPDIVMNAIGVKQGMYIAEIGAGHGRYVVQLAVKVGKKGKIYAEDINKSSINHLKERCKKGNLKNVETIIGKTDDPKLPKGELDLIFVISSYHHFDDPTTLMKNARKALKPNGRVAICEWTTPSGVKPKLLESQMRNAGYILEKIDKVLDKNNMHIYLFKLD